MGFQPKKIQGGGGRPDLGDGNSISHGLSRWQTKDTPTTYGGNGLYVERKDCPHRKMPP